MTTSKLPTQNTVPKWEPEEIDDLYILDDKQKKPEIPPVIPSKAPQSALPKGVVMVSNIEENLKKDIIRTNGEKRAKDIFAFISSKGEYLGEFHNYKPGDAANKIAKKILNDTGKKNFAFAIYNKNKNKRYSFMASFSETKQYKNVGPKKILIRWNLALTRI